ncbi:MAG: hypothetical protein IT458_14425 [Planctomycetes bacterium]|nr:hypothetical protein [Planctomycetota bacterium]
MMRATTTLLAALAALAACDAGSGSDIGPDLPRLPTADYRVLVRDDLGRAAANVRLTIDGFAESAATGGGGRGRFLIRPGGNRVLRADASCATASAGDRLVGYAVLAAMPDGDELPYVLHLPNTAASATRTLLPGAVGATTTLDDSAISGAVLTLAAGTVVDTGSASAVTLRLGALATQHVPGTLPAPTSGAWLKSRAILVDPAGTGFAPGAALSVPNDLGLPASGTASLFRLDPASGVWGLAGTGVADPAATRIEAPTGTVAGGGLYVFATAVSVTATVTGQLANLPDPRGGREAVAGALVSLGEARTRARDDGRFVLEDVPLVDASGAPRTLSLELDGGRNWLPVRRTIPYPPGSALDLGLLDFDVHRSSILRTLHLQEGERAPGRRIRTNSVYGRVARVSVGDDLAIAEFEDVEVGDQAQISTSPSSDIRGYLVQGFAVVKPEDLNTDVRLFAQEIDYYTSSYRGTSTYVVDSVGEGPLEGIPVSRGGRSGPPEFIGYTQRDGRVVIDLELRDAVTASAATKGEGRTVVSSFTATDFDTGRIEVPVARALRNDLGAFDRHGLYRGMLIGGAGTTRGVQATRRITLEDWYDEVFAGRSMMGRVPKPLDPAFGGVLYAIGVPAPLGNLSATEGTTSGPIFTLERFGFAADLAPAQGVANQLDLPLTQNCDTPHLVRGALRGLDLALAPADLRFDLAVQTAAGRVVDVARGVGGNHSAAGDDVTLTLPALAGSLAGGRHWVALGGSALSGGRTITQKAVLDVVGQDTSAGGFLAPPPVLEPAPGATVSSNGFTVRFAVPAGTLYLLVQMRNVVGDEVREWTAFVPNDVETFTFFRLPAEHAMPLIPGRTWTLTVTAVRVAAGPFARNRDPYSSTMTHYVGINAAERRVDAWSSTSFTVQTN